MELFNGMSETCSARASDTYFEVNNYGETRGLRQDMITRRPAGRPDYHMIYVRSGRVEATVGAEHHTVTPGGLLLYRPGDAQLYRYIAGETGDYFWFHFTGVGCEELLGTLFASRPVITVEDTQLMVEVMRDLRAHCAGGDTLSREYARGRMIMLFAMLKRAAPHRDRAVERVLMHIRREPFGEGSVALYASLADMSETHFSRRFKAYTGMSPHRYKTRLLMRHASELLLSTEMNVTEVAMALGITDSLYFSRLFKREFGVSPLAYRRKT